MVFGNNKMEKSGAKEIVLEGIGASPSICIGKAYLVDKEGVNVIAKYYIKESEIKKEINRFKTSIKLAQEDLKAIISETSKDVIQSTDIVETHIALLKDKWFYNRTVEIIKKELVNAEWALKKVVTHLKNRFKDISTPYLKGRISDISHLSDKIMKNLTGTETVNIGTIKKRVILVATELSASETTQIRLEKVKGFITDRGGRATHSGIIARALEIPAVVGLKNASKIIYNDDMLIVDGNKGIVIVNPKDKTLAKYKALKEEYENYKIVTSKSSHLPALTADGILVEVLGNIELPKEVISVIDNGGSGIGLFRTEFHYLGRRDFPSEFELFDKYKNVVEFMAPNPVIIRTLDINGDQAISSSANSVQEANPLGLRSIRYCLSKPDVFIIQLRAILRAAVFGNVKIMFPMISGVSEVIAAKQLLNEAASSLEKEGIAYKKNIEIGIMIEVPSAVIMADVLADEVDFFSIGTNDLIQYSLAIDRENSQVAHLFNPLNPAIIRMIKHTVDVAASKKVKTFMCGEMAADPFNLLVILGIGIDAISMTPPCIPAVKNIIRTISLYKAKELVKEVLKQSTTSKINELIESVLANSQMEFRVSLSRCL